VNKPLENEVTEKIPDPLLEWRGLRMPFVWLDSHAHFDAKMSSSEDPKLVQDDEESRHDKSMRNQKVGKDKTIVFPKRHGIFSISTFP